MRQAVVLVGGRGTRLGALADDKPKPLVTIDGDTRFLDYLIEDLVRHGIVEILLLAGHLGEQVEARYHGARIRGCEIVVVREPHPAGTGGALLCARDLLDPAFLMLNGDSFFAINFLALRETMQPHDLGALALRHVENASRYGAVEHASGRVLRFREKDLSLTGAWISGGVYLLRRDILDLMGPPPVSIEIDIFPAAAAANRLACMGFEGYFIDIGLPETLMQGRRELPEARRRPAVFFHWPHVLTGPPAGASEFAWRPGAVDAIRAVNDAGWLAVVVDDAFADNREQDAFESPEGPRSKLQASLADAGAHIDGLYRGRHPSLLPNVLSDLPVDALRSVVIDDDGGTLSTAATESGLHVRHGREHDPMAAVRAILETSAGTLSG